MEDVVLHYKPGPGPDLPALIQATEKLLAPFPQRPLQVFTPWFPSIVDRHLPLRPARRPPRILSAPDLTNEGPGPKEKGLDQGRENNEIDPEFTDFDQEPNTSKTPDRGVPFVPETPPDADLQKSPQNPKQCLNVQDPGLQAPEPGLQVQERGMVRSRPESEPESPSKRCWTVFSHRLLTKDRTKDQNRAQTRVQTSSRRFQQTVSKLRLHSRQRVKWVIDRSNCRDIEQVWRLLSRPTLGLSLPSCCNAHVDRTLGQVWVYCDLLQSEHVGLTLKQALRLRGRISLWERTRGAFYSL